jgi:hypothetical protein
MSRLADALHAMAVAAWAGALWAIGLIAVPVLFGALGDRALAGQLAARLLACVGILGLGCAAYLLLFRLVRFHANAFGQAFFWVVVAMVLLILVGQFWVDPILAVLKGQVWPHRVAEELLRDRSAAWHGVTSALYLIECVFAGLLVILQQNVPR